MLTSAGVGLQFTAGLTEEIKRVPLSLTVRLVIEIRQQCGTAAWLLWHLSPVVLDCNTRKSIADLSAHLEPFMQHSARNQLALQDRVCRSNALLLLVLIAVSHIWMAFNSV